MKKISKILVILLINIVCILINKGISYGVYGVEDLPSLQTLISNLGSDIEEKLEDANNSKIYCGDTGVGYQSKLYKVNADNSIMSTNATYTYCVTRGIGNLGQASDGQYNMQACIIITKKGIFYNSARLDNPSDYSQYQLYMLSWDELKNHYPEDLVNSAKKMYYILKADNKYGKNHNSNTAESEYQLRVNCYSSPSEKLSVWTTERQYAIWMTVNPLLREFGRREDGILEFNEKGEITNNGPCVLLNEAEKERITIDEPVYMWYLKAPEGTEYGLYQDILIGGTREKNTLKKGSLTITKVDSKDNSKKLSGAEFVISTNQVNITSINGSTTWTTDNQGKTTISGLKAGTTYYIYESKAPKGYNLSDQGGVKEGLGVYIGSLYVSPEGGNVPWTVTNKTGGRRQWK